MIAGTKEVLLENNPFGGADRRWYLHHEDCVETVDYQTFKSSDYRDVSKYNELGGLEVTH